MDDDSIPPEQVGRIFSLTVRSSDNPKQRPLVWVLFRFFYFTNENHGMLLHLSCVSLIYWFVDIAQTNWYRKLALIDSGADLSTAPLREVSTEDIDRGLEYESFQIIPSPWANEPDVSPDDAQPSYQCYCEIQIEGSQESFRAPIFVRADNRLNTDQEEGMVVLTCPL